MNDTFMLIPALMQEKLAVSQIMACNEAIAEHGMVLSPKQAQELVETRTEALRGSGRVEFGDGILDKLVLAFCDSPFLGRYQFADTIHDLIEIFYYYKNETLDRISDDDLIALMKEYFDGSCQGSIELLRHRELDALAHNIRFGKPAATPLVEPDKAEEWEEEEE